MPFYRRRHKHKQRDDEELLRRKKKTNRKKNTMISSLTLRQYELYLSKVSCQSEISANMLSDLNTTFMFDSYLSSSTNWCVRDHVIQMYILPKVCMDIVFDYLPNVITVMHKYVYPAYLNNSTTTNISELLIIVNEYEYSFTMAYSSFRMIITKNDNYDTHNYMSCSSYMDLIFLFGRIIANIEYNDDRSHMKSAINALCLDNFTVLDIDIFLQIMCCIHHIAAHVTEYTKPEIIVEPRLQSNCIIL